MTLMHLIQLISRSFPIPVTDLSHISVASATLFCVDMRSIGASPTDFLFINVYVTYRPRRFAMENLPSILT
jgi:hypothetical protein